MSYQLLPHTADLRAALEGASLDELYADGAALVREILVGKSAVTARNEHFIRQLRHDDAENLFRFIRELVYLYDAEGFVPCTARRVQTGTIVGGELFDAARHEPHHHPKALTRHGFVLERTAERYRAELVFDL